MAVHHLDNKFSMDRLLREVKTLALATIQNAAIGSAGIRVYDGGWVTIENGGLSVTGSALVSGNLDVTGRLDGSGTFDWTGPMWLRGSIMIPGNLTGVGTLLWSGPWEMRGNGDITGNVDITGALDVRNRITLDPNGYLEAGLVRIDRGGTYGGRVASTGSFLEIDAGIGVRIISPLLYAAEGRFSGSVDVTGGLEVGGAKNFKIPHPAKSDHVLRHGSTESPVSGVEYWGEETLNKNGELTVTLPDYFEALTKQENRAILVTPRGFVADWGDIVNGQFTVTGKPGGRFSWLVKAERHGADFPVEESQPAMDSRTQYLSQDK